MMILRETRSHLRVSAPHRPAKLHGRPVHLTPTEYALLRLLSTNAGRVPSVAAAEPDTAAEG